MTERKSYAVSHLMPVVTGCYMLFHNRKLVYVGRSGNVYARIEEHRKNGREFDYAAVTALPDIDAPWVEKALIDAMETRMNRQRPPEPKAAEPQTPRPSVKPLKPVREVISMATAKLRVSERARGLGLNLDAALKAGAFPSYHDGRSTRMRAADLDAWITAELDARFGKKAKA